MSSILILKTGFNIQYWSRYSLEAFLLECIASKVFVEYGPEKQKELLLIAYSLIKSQ